MVAPTPFGTLIHEARLRTNLTQRGLAERVGLSHVFVGEVERGNRPTIGEAHWQKLALHLPITLEQIRAAAIESRLTAGGLRERERAASIIEERIRELRREISPQPDCLGVFDVGAVAAAEALIAELSNLLNKIRDEAP